MAELNLHLMNSPFLQERQDQDVNETHYSNARWAALNDIVQDLEESDLVLDEDLNTSILATTSQYSYHSGSSSTGTEATRWDFLALVSAVCDAYKQGTYLKLMLLNERDWEPLNEGAVFRVSRSQMKFTVFSAHNHRTKEIVTNSLVTKKNSYGGSDMAPAQIRSFVKELRVLHHMKAHPFIVDLRGVGWFDEPVGDDERIFTPALILEQAFQTLDYYAITDDQLDYDHNFAICGQITSALRALHQCRIAHGDLKPSNILVFKKNVVREGIKMNSYIAKLSDFESVAYEADKDLFFPAGTAWYRAPEVAKSVHAGNTKVTFDDLILSDAWSLGVVFSIFLSGQKASPMTQFRRTDALKSHVRLKLESGTADSYHVTIVEKLLDWTLCQKPSDRDLDSVERILRPFMGDDAINFASPGFLDIYPENDLTISHESLKPMAGPFRDKIVSELESLSGIMEDPRRPKALWELGIMSLSYFANPQASIDRGLHYVLRAAQEGDIRAMAMVRHLHKSYDRPCPCSKNQIWSWLKDAAVAGHEFALTQLRELDPATATTAQAARAEQYYKSLTDSGQFSLHHVAATGDKEKLRTLLGKGTLDIDKQDPEGDTALILACRFGQFATANILLDQGANAKRRNKYGENALHYVWCFDSQHGMPMIQRLAEMGANICDTSHRMVCASELDILPVLPGTPVERAAGRVRADLVRNFVDRGALGERSNGRLPRLLLLWALRLHDFDSVDYLMKQHIFTLPRLTMPTDQVSATIQHTVALPILKTQKTGRRYADHIFDSQGGDNGNRPLQTKYCANLAPLIHTKWLRHGEERNLLDAVCAGWISQSEVGSSYPLRFWLVSRHGDKWREALHRQMENLIEMSDFVNAVGEPWITEADIDRSIEWTFRESMYDAFVSLLHCKFEKTPGDRLRLNDLSCLTWNVERLNSPIIEPQVVYLIDQVFYNAAKGGTLAQQALLSGDRHMFRILTRRYTANACLPAPLPPSPRLVGTAAHSPILKGQLNLYSLLAYTNHRDLWFGDELRRLSVPLCCPWPVPPFETKGFDLYAAKDQEYAPPLVHALAVPFKAYIIWLLNHGANLSERVSERYDMLDVIMRSRSLGLIGFFFRGPRSTDLGARFVPDVYRDSVGPEGSSKVLQHFFDANATGPRISTAMLHPGNACSDSDDLEHPEDWWEESRTNTIPDRILSCYWYLLQCYPDAKIPLSTPFFTVLGDKIDLPYMLSANINLPKIVEEHRRRMAKRIPGRWSVRASLRYMTWSLADSWEGKQLATVMSILPGISLSDFSPGFFWKPSLFVWLSAIISAVWAFFLWWMRGVFASLINSQAGNFNEYCMPNGSLVSHRLAPLSCEDGSLLMIMMFLLGFFVGFLLVMSAFPIAYVGLASILFGIVNTVPLWRLGKSSIGHFLILLAYLTVSASLGIFSHALMCFMAVRLAQLKLTT